MPSGTVMTGKFATGEIEDARAELSSAAAQLGSKGGKARAAAISPERRAQIGRQAAYLPRQNQASFSARRCRELTLSCRDALV